MWSFISLGLEGEKDIGSSLPVQAGAGLVWERAGLLFLDYSPSALAEPVPY